MYTTESILIIEMCCANNFHKFYMQRIQQRALNYNMQHFVAQCSHKYES